MFIRRTKTGSSAEGKTYYTYRLVRNERRGNKVVQRTLLNLGRYFSVEKEHWGMLCSLIEDILAGQQRLFTGNIPESIAREANRIAHRLINSKKQEKGREEPGSGGVDIQKVDVDSLEMSRPRSVGVEHVALWAMGQVDFMGMLTGLGLSGPQRAAAIGCIIGRMACPGSELATYRWLNSTSALGELIDADFEVMNPMRLYRVSDLLLGKRTLIEDRLFACIHDLFSLSCTVTLYDLTNTYFEGDAFNNNKAKRGHSKEKRTDRPLVTLGLVLDSSGFVKRSDLFAGNVSEARTLQDILRSLDAPQGSLVVMDRGVASEENIRWLKENGYRYLVVSRKRHREFDFGEAVSLSTASEEKVHIQKVTEDEEVLLYCYSEIRGKKEEAIIERFCKRFEEGLEKISSGLKRPRTVKKIERIHERIGRLKERSHGVSRHYRVEVIPDDTGKKAVEIRWEKVFSGNTILTHPGVYCLRTNEMEWDEERLWRTYTMLTDLEGVFRTLKSDLGLRPIYHSKEERCDGHIFITVLAYQFVQIIRKRLGDHNIRASWSTIRSILSTQQRITATFKRADGRTLHVRKASVPEPGQQEIYQALCIDMKPGGVRKTLI